MRRYLFNGDLSLLPKKEYDVVIIGSMAAFGIIYCHQSVELGIFAVNPSLLPYVILGILLGRVNYVKERSLR